MGGSQNIKINRSLEVDSKFCGWFEEFNNSVKEVTSDEVETPREFKVEPKGVTELLLRHDKNGIDELLLIM